MDLAKYAALFQVESTEQLSTMNEELLALERAPAAPEPVGAIFRAVHTMKGMSATMGYATVTALAHELESLLDRVRHAELAVDQGVIDALFAAVDALEQAVGIEVAGGSAAERSAPVFARLRALAPTTPLAAPVAAAATPVAPRVAPASAGRASPTVRIELRRLDGLMNLAGELLIARGRLGDVAHAIADPALDESLARASRLITELHEEIVASRMVPVGQVFDRFPRLVRDAAHALGKEIELTLEGREIELDRSMLDEIGEPIVHLLRNAADHGIESPEERERAGKPRAGQLALTVTRERRMITIRVRDDGRGIDRMAVLARARAQGLVGEGTQSLSDEDLVGIIARPGFSTARTITDLSGRGVGVDVVFTRVRALGGAVEIRTAPGAGTTVTLRLPVTLAIVRALLARVEDETYAIPMTHVNETVDLAPSARRHVQGRDVMLLRDDVLPLLDFRTVVGLPEAPFVSVSGLSSVVVVETDGRRAGLVVDELAGQQDIVVKTFDGVRDGLALFSGATILDDGLPALIVDVGSLL
jgi:two-component system, chemotaxis family, sensor kinase CheA